MSIRRTKKEKIKNQKFEQQPVVDLAAISPGKLAYSLPKSSDTTLAKKTSAAEPSSLHKIQDLFHYDTRLIYKDLRKTLLITVFIFALLGAVTYYFARLAA
jgi:hypothetical protein